MPKKMIQLSVLVYLTVSFFSGNHPATKSFSSTSLI
jgi:hypothetical protein